MEKENILLKFLKLIACVILGCLLWMIIISIVMPTELESQIEKNNQISMILGIITGIFIDNILVFNNISSAKQRIKESRSNIDVTLKRSTALLEKANKVVDKYITHEGETLKEISKEKLKMKSTNKKKVNSAIDFQNMIESYPELKSNESIILLLNQLTESENIISNFKIKFNQMVRKYNSSINAFPGMIYKSILKWQEEEYFKEDIMSNMISDDELGI